MHYYSIIGKIARLMPAEMAHNAAIAALKHGLVLKAKLVESTLLETDVLGLKFANPVGLAAGFDKNADATDALLKQGFGFIELGTVTPLPQPGNPRPRLFRLLQDEAIINRFGFNSSGIHTFTDNLKKSRKSGIVGANIGKNKDSMDAIYDYAAALQAVYPLVDYITVNISSPNTVGLRDLQQKEALAELMQAIAKIHIKLATGGKPKPLLYKIAPDLNTKELEAIIEVAFANKIDGLIVSNTTIARPASLKSMHKQEKGGLSGKPLKELSTHTLKEAYRLSKGKIPLIGVGGVGSAEDAYEKIQAGASLVQLYTALVYQGFGIVRQINEGLVKLLERDGFRTIKEAIGVNAVQ